MKTKVVSATEFKAKCLAILDEVDDKGGSVTITKRGLPVAVQGPEKNRVENRFLARGLAKYNFLTTGRALTSLTDSMPLENSVAWIHDFCSTRTF
jgi:antitoxin (DNA-binding transcriptional repressor) of toxin-antitoxin stability system